MAINFETNSPSSLLAAFKKAIDDKKVVTWAYDSDGDFTHTPDQWKNRGWMCPSISNGRLTMNFFGRRSEVTTWDVYAVYHGRLIESMTAHCNSLFSEARVPSQPANGDVINTNAA